MESFDLDGLLRAARDAQSLSARLQSMHQSLGEYEGRDASQMVTAVVGPAGGLERLDVADSWRARLKPADFPAAVAQAVTAAQRAFGEAFGDVLARAVDSPPDPAPSLAWNPLGMDLYDLFGANEDDTLDRLIRLNRQIDELIENLERQPVEENATPGEILGIGERGMVEIRLDSVGGLVGFDVDQSWLARCPRWMLMEELGSALDSARRSIPKAPNFLATKVDW